MLKIEEIKHRKDSWEYVWEKTRIKLIDIANKKNFDLNKVKITNIDKGEQKV